MESRILIYGIGNSLRQDDALGARFIAALEQQDLPVNVDLDTCYQLNIEDALKISEYSEIYFVDASHEMLPGGFSLKPLVAANNIEFSTHAIAPSSILGLCEDLYQKHPLVFVLAISGSSWEIGKDLSSAAKENMLQAMRFLLKRIGSKPAITEDLYA